MQRDDVRLAHCARVNALIGLHDGQRLNPVTQTGRAFELHGLRRRRHVFLEPLLYFGRFPAEKVVGLLHQLGIILRCDLAAARPRTALHMVVEARPVARLHLSVGTGAQQEHLLQRIQRPVHRARAGKRAVIAAFARFRPAMFLQPWKLMLRGNKDIGKTFVIAQQHVVARLQLLDEVLFQQKRLCLGRGRQEHHRRSFRDHPRDPPRVAGGARIA